MTTKDHYSKLAESYNELHREEQQKKLEIIRSQIKSEGLTLDVGCGTGFANQFFKKTISLDPSMGMLKKFRGLRVCGKAESPPFKNKTFNTIICVTAIHHIKISQFIKEAKRVAKPKASLAFTVLKKAQQFKKIVQALKKSFTLKEIDEEKDLILIEHVE